MEDYLLITYQNFIAWESVCKFKFWLWIQSTFPYINDLLKYHFKFLGFIRYDKTPTEKSVLTPISDKKINSN